MAVGGRDLPAPVCSLPTLLSTVPSLLDVLPSEARSALLSCSSELRTLIRRTTQTLTLCQDEDIRQVLRLKGADWPRLALVISKGNFAQRTALQRQSSSLHVLWVATMKQEAECHHAFVMCPTQHDKQPQPQAVKSKHAQTAFSCLATSKWQDTTRVALQYNALGTDGITALSAIWPRLLELDLSNSRWDAISLSQLAKGPWPALRQLDLSNTKLDIEGVQSLAEGQWPSLLQLNLSRNPSLNAAAFALVSQALSWPLLSSLSLGNKLSADSFVEVSRMSRRLDLLLITSSDLRKSMSVFAQKEWFKLKFLSMHNCHLGSKEIALLVTPSLPSLQSLKLSHNRFGLYGAKHLARGRWPALTVLDLSSNELGDLAMRYIAMGSWPNLRSLNLAHNHFSVTGLKFLTQASWRQLRKLSLHRGLWCVLTKKLFGVDPAGARVTVNAKVITMFRTPVPVPGGLEVLWPELHSVDFVPLPFVTACAAWCMPIICSMVVCAMVFAPLIRSSHK